MNTQSVSQAQRASIQGRVVISVPWSWKFEDPPEWSNTVVLRRRSDWGLSRLSAMRLAGSALLDLVTSVRRGDHVVLATLGPRAGLYAAAARLKGPASVAVFDFLYSPRGAPAVLRWLLRSCVDTFVVIRRGDAQMLARRFGVPITSVRFVPWAVGDSEVFDMQTSDGDYLYAAGWAHRDWEMLIRALRRYPVPAILAPGGQLPDEDLPEGITIIDMPAPDKGREIAAHSKVVAVLLKDCEYAAGPLVLLDALAMGKPVIVSDANGNRDYVRPGVTGLSVPPGDDAALSEAIRRAWADPGLRSELSGAARTAAREFNARAMWSALLSAVLGQAPARDDVSNGVGPIDRG